MYDIFEYFKDRFYRVQVCYESFKLGDIKEALENVIDNIDSENSADFWYYVEHGESTSKEEYFKIRNSYFKVLGLADAKSLSAEEVHDSLKRLLIARICNTYSEEVNFSASIVDNLMRCILQLEWSKKFFSVSIYSEYYRNNKFENMIYGEIDINKTNEANPQLCGFSEGFKVYDEETPDNKRIDYNTIYSFDYNRILTEGGDLFYTELVDLSDFLEYSLDIENKENKLTFQYLHTDIDRTSYDGFENSLADVDVAFFNIKDAWEQYLYESNNLYHLEKYNTAFLVGFTAFESFVEFIIDKLINVIKEQSKNIDISFDSIIDIELSDVSDVKQLMELVLERQYFWYDNYHKLKNDRRRLIEEKLTQIFLLIQRELEIDTDILEITKNTLKKLNETRNILAHGVEHEFDDEDFKLFYGQLLLAMANIIQFLQGERLFERIEVE